LLLQNAFIGDVRQLLKVLTMFLPLPLFWALSDQQGSRWTLQAEHMDGDIVILYILEIYSNSEHFSILLSNLIL
jgi:dipeptide/tripeptide permease